MFCDVVPDSWMVSYGGVWLRTEKTNKEFT